jgi:anti-anti-sigma factor
VSLYAPKAPFFQQPLGFTIEASTYYALTGVQRRPTCIPPKKASPKMDLRRKRSSSDAFGTAVPRIELNGEYDLSNKEEIASLFGSLRAGGPAVVDLTNVTYMDSTVLQELVKLRDRFEAQTITLLVRSENVRRLLQVVQFENLFEVIKA